MDTCELLIVNGTLVDGTGAPDAGIVAVTADRLRIVEAGRTAPATRPDDRCHRQGGRARFHRPPLPLAV